MGRLRRYRERIAFEMNSVRAKSVRAMVVRTLESDYGRSRLEAAVLAEGSLQWLATLGVKRTQLYDLMRRLNIDVAELRMEIED